MRSVLAIRKDAACRQGAVHRVCRIVRERMTTKEYVTVTDTIATFDLPALRSETPGCANVAHLNNAGAALMPRPVLDTVQRHLELEAAIGGYEAADEAGAALEAVYAAIARLLHAAPGEIAVVENATRGFDHALHAIDWRPGDAVLTPVAEYESNYLALLRLAELRGVEVHVVPDGPDGVLSTQALADLLARPGLRARALTLAHVPTNEGLVQPAAAASRLAHDAGALVLLDACQSAGQLPLDVTELGADVVCASARKFLRGPRGIGFLYVREAIAERLQPTYADMRAAIWQGPRGFAWRPGARRFENWETNVAAVLGMGAAVAYALALGVENTWPRVYALADALRARLRDVPGVSVRDGGARACGIVTFAIAGHDAEELHAALRARGINVSVASDPARRYTLQPVRRDAIPHVLRASPHYYNTQDEVEMLAVAIEEIAGCGQAAAVVTGAMPS